MARNNIDDNQNFDFHEDNEQQALDDFDKREEIGVEIRSRYNIQTATKLKSGEERILSQKMSQLSTNASYELDFIRESIQNICKKIPVYLTKRNQSFQQILKEALSTNGIEPSDCNQNELRKIALLIYKSKVLQMYHRLWTTYLKSGMGQLINDSEQQLNYSTNLPIWPKELKTMLKSIKVHEANENMIFKNFIQYYMTEFDHELKQSQMEWNRQLNKFNGYTLNIEKILDNYIEKNLTTLCMEIEHQIELVSFDYHIHAIKQEYNRHKPNEYQRNLMKQLCRSKYEQETTEQEFNFIQQQRNYYESPSQSFENLPIAQLSLINSIENPDIRRQLFNQCKTIAEQSRTQLLDLYTKTAEDQRNEYKKKLQDDCNEMWSKYRAMQDNEKIASIMIDLINERCKKIGQRIQCIYKFRSDSFLLK